MKHRGFDISYCCKPIPDRQFDFEAVPPDYDGEQIILYGATLAEVKNEIDNNVFSNCCFETPIPETDLCSKCKEHAEFLTEEDLENE